MQPLKVFELFPKIRKLSTTISSDVHPNNCQKFSVFEIIDIFKNWSSHLRKTRIFFTKTWFKKILIPLLLEELVAQVHLRIFRLNSVSEQNLDLSKISVSENTNASNWTWASFRHIDLQMKLKNVYNLQMIGIRRMFHCWR